MEALSKHNKLLLVLVALNTALLVASNAAGAKLIAVSGGLAASATVFSYALSFLFTDLISELYGKEAAKLAVRIGFVGLLLSVAFITLAIYAPPAAFWENQEAYEITLGLGPRLLLGGWTSYMVSQHLDVWIFHRIRVKTKGKHMWLRNNASTMVSQFVDTCIFMTIAFYGIFPLIPAILGQYAIKLVIAVLDTPIFYVVIGIIRRRSERVGEAQTE